MAKRHYEKSVKTGRWYNSPTEAWERKAKESYLKISKRGSVLSKNGV